MLSAPYYTCISGGHEGQLLISLDVTSKAVSIISKPLLEFVSSSGDSSLRPLDGNSVEPGFLLDDDKIILLKVRFLLVCSCSIINCLLFGQLVSI